MNEDDRPKIIPIEDLTLWVDKGRMTVAVRNGYPRMTWFHRDTDGFVSANMRAENLVVIGMLLRKTAQSKEDVKHSIMFYNTDYNTKEKILQSIMIIAKRGNAVILGLKAADNLPLNKVVFEATEWVRVYKNDDNNVEVSGSLYAERYAELLIQHGERLGKEFIANKETIRANEQWRKDKAQEPANKPVVKEESKVESSLYDDDIL